MKKTSQLQAKRVGEDCSGRPTIPSHLKTSDSPYIRRTSDNSKARLEHACGAILWLLQFHQSDIASRQRTLETVRCESLPFHAYPRFPMSHIEALNTHHEDLCLGTALWRSHPLIRLCRVTAVAGGRNSAVVRRPGSPKEARKFENGNLRMVTINCQHGKGNDRSVPLTGFFENGTGDHSYCR